MKLLADKDIKCFFLGVICVMTAFLLLSQMAVWVQFGTFSLPLFLLFLLAAGGVFAVCFRYIHKRNKILERAAAQIRSYLDGNTDARIDCDEEGELYHLFHCVNTLAAVLNAHAANENREKEFLKNTISDISHQLKTPLAALNIYNGLLQGEAEGHPAVKEFSELSEQELDRIETLVQSLLKITKLDAGSIVIEKLLKMWRNCCGMWSCILPIVQSRSKRRLFCPGRMTSGFPVTGIGCWKPLTTW